MMIFSGFSAGLMVFCHLFSWCTCSFKTRICREANASLQYVQSCPSNSTEYQQRSLLKRCSAISYEPCSIVPLEYHCIPDHERRRLIKVCAPKVLITGHHCSQFNVGIGQVIEDVKKCDVCPFNYDSTEGFKYNQCYEDIVIRSSTNRFEEAQSNNLFNKTSTIKTTFTAPSEPLTGKTSKEGPRLIGMMFFAICLICAFTVAIVLLKK